MCSIILLTLRPILYRRSPELFQPANLTMCTEQQLLFFLFPLTSGKHDSTLCFWEFGYSRQPCKWIPWYSSCDWLILFHIISLRFFHMVNSFSFCFKAKCSIAMWHISFIYLFIDWHFGFHFLVIVDNNATHTWIKCPFKILIPTLSDKHTEMELLDHVIVPFYIQSHEFLTSPYPY